MNECILGPHDKIPSDYTGKVIFSDTGSILYLKQGKWHREDGPAYIGGDDDDKTLEWWVEDLRHRIGGPAFIRDGDNLYCIDGTIMDEQDYWLHPKLIKYKFELITEF